MAHYDELKQQVFDLFKLDNQPENGKDASKAQSDDATLENSAGEPDIFSVPSRGQAEQAAADGGTDISFEEPVSAPATDEVVTENAQESLSETTEENTPSPAPVSNVEEEEAPAPAAETPHALTRRTLRRAALAFLTAGKVNAAGIAPRMKDCRTAIDAAAVKFVTSEDPQEGTPNALRTAIAVCCLTEDDVAVDPVKKQSLRDALKKEELLKEEFEALIRQDEPELCDESLFDEPKIWHYELAKSRKYHACLRRIEKINYSLAHADRFERLVFEKTADKYYLVCPEGAIDAKKVPSEWGIVRFSAEKGTCTLEREGAECVSSKEKRTELLFAVAASCLQDAVFANGVASVDGKAAIIRTPKRRRS